MNLKMYKLERLDREDTLDWDGVEILRERYRDIEIYIFHIKMQGEPQ